MEWLTESAPQAYCKGDTEEQGRLMAESKKEWWLRQSSCGRDGKVNLGIVSDGAPTSR